MALSELNSGTAWREKTMVTIHNFHTGKNEADYLKCHGHLHVDLSSAWALSGDYPDNFIRATYVTRWGTKYHKKVFLKIMIPVNPLQQGMQPIAFLEFTKEFLVDLIQRLDPESWEDRREIFYKSRTQNAYDFEMEERPAPGQQVPPNKGYGPVTTFRSPARKPFNPKKKFDIDFKFKEIDEWGIGPHEVFPGAASRQFEEILSPAPGDFTYPRKMKGSNFIMQLNCILISNTPDLCKLAKPAYCTLPDHNPHSFKMKQLDFVLWKESNSPPTQCGVTYKPNLLQNTLEQEYVFACRYANNAPNPYKKINTDHDKKLAEMTTDNLRLHLKLEEMAYRINQIEYRTQQNINNYLAVLHNPHYWTAAPPAQQQPSEANGPHFEHGPVLYINDQPPMNPPLPPPMSPPVSPPRSPSPQRHPEIINE